MKRCGVLPLQRRFLPPACNTDFEKSKNATRYTCKSEKWLAKMDDMATSNAVAPPSSFLDRINYLCGKEKPPVSQWLPTRQLPASTQLAFCFFGGQFAEQPQRNTGESNEGKLSRLTEWGRAGKGGGSAFDALDGEKLNTSKCSGQGCTNFWGQV